MSSNCKVHFAGSDNSSSAICALKANDVKYRLFTAYPFIKNKKSNYQVSDIIEDRAGFSHVIIDSGLFTLMFGAKKGGQLGEQDMRDWMHRIVLFAQQNDIKNASYVECDCQKLCGTDAAWRIRQEMRELLPDTEIINVFHIEDGSKGFDRLVEFSDYIAISVPELRINRPKSYKEMTCTLAKRARAIKPGVKIHLLGCTEKFLLQRNSFVTSADSSSWLSPARYGFFGKNSTNKLTEQFKEEAVRIVQLTADALQLDLGAITKAKAKNIATYYLSAKLSRADYTQWCGSQE